MHTAIVHLAPMIAAEKSKTPFYIAGGALVAWALILSMAIGMRSATFPGSLAGQRAVMAISFVLVLATVSMAVVTSGGSSEKSAQAATSTGTAPSTPTQPSAATQPSAPGQPHAPSRPSAPAQSSTLQEAADPGGQLAYTTKSLSAKAGKVTIDFANQSPVPHNLTIARGSKVLGATPTFQGSTKTLTLNLEPGTYTFYCSVPGHRAAGMEGTLTVQ